MSAAHASPDRLLTFELARSLYAIPISGVLEVAEVGPLACIPSLPLQVGGIANHHGDALPVVQAAALLGGEDASAHRARPARVLVIGTAAAGAARLGLPVDLVLGLVDGGPARARGVDPVAESRPLGGRVARILDPVRLLERARDVIDRSAGGRPANRP